jgi:hypothetical protein
MATTVLALAVELGVDEGDVNVLLEQLGEREPELPAELEAFVRAVLDPEGQRTGLLRSPDADGPKQVVPTPAALHDPIPVNVGVPGCPGMVRRGSGQWAQCAGVPVWAGTVVGGGRRRYLVFACGAHREVVHRPRAMTDVRRLDRLTDTYGLRRG